jgi:hypothetical protein
MSFMFFFYPALAATLEERKRMRPIARHTEPWQKMFDEVAELSRMAEDLGFEAVTFPEHHLHTEGAEMGSLPVLTQYVINKTNRIKVGTTSDIRCEMDLLVETANPEWFIWQSDQGYLPLEQVKQMLKRFGKEILPHYV